MTTPIESMKSRRALLVGGLGGATALLAGAFGRSSAARAAAGDPVIAGQLTTAGANTTEVRASGSGATLLATNTGSGAAVRGNGADGHGGYLRTTNAASYGLLASQDATGAGGGAAVRANGKQNTGVRATTATSSRYAVHGSTSATDGVAVYGAGYVGVWGESNNQSLSVGVVGNSATGRGVQGVSQSSIGVRAVSTSGVGLFATSDSSTGILGRTMTGEAAIIGESTDGERIGVKGVSATHTGVYGICTAGSSAGNGVYGESNTGLTFQAAVKGANPLYGTTGYLGSPSAGVLGNGGDSGRAGYFQGSVLLNSDLEFLESTAPPAYPNSAKVFARDSGAGKTQLCVKFGSGAVQVIATEP